MRTYIITYLCVSVRLCACVSVSVTVPVPMPMPVPVPVSVVVCLYLCLCLCLYLCLCLRMFLCLCLCLCLSLFICVCVSVCVCQFLRVYEYVSHVIYRENIYRLNCATLARSSAVVSCECTTSSCSSAILEFLFVWFRTHSQSFGRTLVLRKDSIFDFGAKIQIYGAKIQIYGNKIQIYSVKTQIRGAKIQTFDPKFRHLNFCTTKNLPLCTRKTPGAGGLTPTHPPIGFSKNQNAHPLDPFSCLPA